MARWDYQILYWRYYRNSANLIFIKQNSLPIWNSFLEYETLFNKSILIFSSKNYRYFIMKWIINYKMEKDLQEQNWLRDNEKIGFKRELRQTEEKNNIY